MKVFEAEGEDVDSLYSAVAQAVTHIGPVAVVVNRKMAPGIEGLEGECEVSSAVLLSFFLVYVGLEDFTDPLLQGHEAVPVKIAIKHLTSHGYGKEVTDILLNMKVRSKLPRPMLFPS